jgi:pilus assembly protein Flp/PilA
LPTGGFDREDIVSKFLSKFVRDESGATAIEYGLIAALVAVVLVTALSAMGNKLSGTFNKVTTSLPA